MSSATALNVYLLFVSSWFLHFPARLPVLGVMRLDLLLIGMLAGLAFLGKERSTAPASRTAKWLWVLVAYTILTLPFVEWPGSVLRTGIPEFAKAVVFFFFTVAFVRTEADLKKFMTVFIVCQLIRSLEPLYLHVTEGYWGSVASMGNWEYLDRLSGAPSDTINPNGLAFVICTVLPFLYFMSGLSAAHRAAAVALGIPCLYALMLTGSRSGMLGLLVILAGIMLKSRKRGSLAVMAIGGVCLIAAAVSLMSPDMQDRYLSMVGMGKKNEASAEDRLAGLMPQVRVAMRKPLFGHGLGTSPETNGNFLAEGPYAFLDRPAHNLYIEVAQEIGMVGLLIFLLFMKSTIQGFAETARRLRGNTGGEFLARLNDAMQVWLVMCVVFSLASYGLSSYEWYLAGGLAVVVQRIVMQKQTTSEAPGPLADSAMPQAVPEDGAYLSRNP